ncbi:MAG: AbrB/MazE/SpoVT family DNA-binding domain-containing protein [Bacilli bacterium]|nr:AbrB/MazE/SpoVT family DNA-binding domain-containing protein [Bacilli bacterium]
MEVKLQRWGNSNGIRIPNIMLKTLNLKANDMVNIEQVDDRIIITKPNNKISLKELFDNYDGPNLTEEFSWDDPVGEELW